MFCMAVWWPLVAVLSIININNSSSSSSIKGKPSRATAMIMMTRTVIMTTATTTITKSRCENGVNSPRRSRRYFHMEHMLWWCCCCCCCCCWLFTIHGIDELRTPNKWFHCMIAQFFFPPKLQHNDKRAKQQLLHTQSVFSWRLLCSSLLCCTYTRPPIARTHT